MFWRNRPFSNTVIFADFFSCQQELGMLWQQDIYHEIPFYLVYKLAKFDDQRISQNWIYGMRRVGIRVVILPNPGRIQGPKSLSATGLCSENCMKVLKPTLIKRLQDADMFSEIIQQSKEKIKRNFLFQNKN